MLLHIELDFNLTSCHLFLFALLLNRVLYLSHFTFFDLLVMIFSFDISAVSIRFILTFLKMCMDVLLTYMSIHHICAVPMEARRGYYFS